MSVLFIFNIGYSDPCQLSRGTPLLAKKGVGKRVIQGCAGANKGFSVQGHGWVSLLLATGSCSLSGTLFLISSPTV